MSTFEGEQLAIEGIAQATDASPALSIAAARDLLLRLCLKQELVDPDYLHALREALGLPDLEHPKAWPGIWRHAMSEGWIEPVVDSSLWRKSARPSQHATLMKMYRSRICGEF
jgi:hypothetical protein